MTDVPGSGPPWGRGAASAVFLQVMGLGIFRGRMPGHAVNRGGRGVVVVFCPFVGADVA